MGKYNVKNNFDELISRKGFGSLKWDHLQKYFSRDDLLPYWIADMDFQSPPEVIETIISLAKHGIYGYTALGSSYYSAVIRWFKQRHGWKIEKEWIVNTPGVIPAINFIIQAFSQPNDKIIVQNPVYYPFYMAIKNNHRKIHYNPL